MLLAHDFRLAARDVVYVDPAQVTRWNRVITQILPTVQTINTTGATNFPPTPRASGWHYRCSYVPASVTLHGRRREEINRPVSLAATRLPEVAGLEWNRI